MKLNFLSKLALSSFFSLSINLLHTMPAQAGAGYIIDSSGAPYVWDNDSAIDLHPESGSCGSFSNSDMLTKLSDNIGSWGDPSTSDIDFNLVTGSVPDVDGDNYDEYLYGVTGASDSSKASDDINPIVFDDDASIIVAVAGLQNKYSVLGFANPVGFNTSNIQIAEAQAVFNCLCLSGNPNGPCTRGSSTTVFTEDDLDFTMVHELGHFLGLDHSQVNHDIYDTYTATGGSSTIDSDGEYLPTMYPVSVNPAEQISLQQDDIITVSSLYPNSTFSSSYCEVTGTLLDSDGNELRCADVWATTVVLTEDTDSQGNGLDTYSMTGDPSTTVAFVSGAYAPATDTDGDGYTSGSGECTSDCGDFTLYLDPSKEYLIKVRSIDSDFTGGSSLSPCGDEQLTTVSYQDLGTLSQSSCIAGQTVNLGNLTTTSSGGVSTGSGTSSSGSSTGTSTSTSGCSLSQEPLAFSWEIVAVLIGGIALIAAEKKRKLQKIKVPAKIKNKRKS